jgi:uncharacterized protein YjbJ (UPF0337 family)
MNSNNDKLKGSVNTAVGSLKERAGRSTGNNELEAKGSVQKTKGRAQKLRGAVKDTIKKGKHLLGIKSNKS